MASFTNATTYNTGKFVGKWVSPQHSYAPKTTNTETDPPKICLDFLAVKVTTKIAHGKRIKKVILVNETTGCKHGLNGTKGGSCSYLHDACFYYLQEGRPIKTLSGHKRRIRCKNGPRCNKSHNVCRDCCYATQKFVSLHAKEDCPHHGFYNKLLKKNGFGEIKEVHLAKDEESKSEPVVTFRTNSRKKKNQTEQAVLDQFEKLKAMASSKTTSKVTVAGSSMMFDLATSWS